MNEVSYTTEEVAKLLKISKLTVYDLIKKGELPAYRVGKQMRIDAPDLELYKQRAKSGVIPLRADTTANLPRNPIPRSSQNEYAADPARLPKTLVITGQDHSLELLSRHFERTAPAYRPLRSYEGSLNSLISMYRGESDIVSTHLLDGDTGEYNLPYINRILTGHSYTVVNLVQRTAGLYVRSGNPKQLKSWSDLRTSGVRLINREKGSGARVLLDEQLKIHGIIREQIEGYDEEETTHMGVAGIIASGKADVGIGIENALSLIGNVDFIPLITERVDLVVLNKPQNREWIELLLHTLQSAEFRQELSAFRGYDLSLTGKIMYQI